ncbi:MAG: hypothetical protein M1839_003949 [Geoglossum umbratile]|nr:MAG: hypothetical protein M1839_003949 [Geoglossum umbratile]
MALERTSVIPESRLTERALQRHTKATANRPKTLRTGGQPASSEMDDSLPSTDLEVIEEMGQILMDPEQERDLLDAFRKNSEFFNAADTFKTPVRESIDLIDTRPACTKPLFLPPQTPEVLPVQNIHGIGTRSSLLTPGPRITPPTMEAAAEEHPRQSIDSDSNLARLINTTSAQEDQLRNVLPSHFPQFQHVQNYGELGFYIDRSQYAISVGPGPVDDLHYGIIIVPFGEEHMLFRSEHESGEVPLAIQQESSLRSADDVQLRITNSTSSVAAREPPTDPAILHKVRSPLKQTRKSREKSSRITKATRTRRPQTFTPIRRSQRLNAGQRTT